MYGPGRSTTARIVGKYGDHRVGPKFAAVATLFRV